jgi:hypothetical protein
MLHGNIELGSLLPGELRKKTPKTPGASSRAKPLMQHLLPEIQ